MKTVDNMTMLYDHGIGYTYIIHKDNTSTLYELNLNPAIGEEDEGIIRISACEMYHYIIEISKLGDDHSFEFPIKIIFDSKKGVPITFYRKEKDLVYMVSEEFVKLNPEKQTVFFGVPYRNTSSRLWYVINSYVPEVGMLNTINIEIQITGPNQL